MAKQETFLLRAKAWAASNRLKGPQAFLRYVMFRFVENLNHESDDFILKGGNLLWVYIKTPRSTIDLDFATVKTSDDKTVKEILSAAGRHSPDIKYIVKNYKRDLQGGSAGASITIAFETDQGARNQFDLDVVFELSTDSVQLHSPVSREASLAAATVENIIADKIATSARFGAGNTRMKDFDDLWRLSQSHLTINKKKLTTLLKERNCDSCLNEDWIGDDLKRAWKNHRREYDDLPDDLANTFNIVNVWLHHCVSQ